MKKIGSIVLALVLMGGLFAACGKSGDSTVEPATTTEEESPDTQKEEVSTATAGGELNLYTWEGMFPDEVLQGFTEETGIKINYSNFDYNENMLAKLEADNASSYDLVIADDYILETIIEKGLATSLDTSKIPNYEHINQQYQGLFFDPSNEYTVPYGSGVQTIVYDPATVDVEIKGYADLWDPSLADSIGIVGNYRVINGAALKVMGQSYNTEDIPTIEAAGAKLLELAPNIRVIKDDNLQNDLISGEISVAIMYTSQVTMAKMARPDLEVVFPSEGIGFGVMTEFIPANAPNPDSAYAFMNYILRPDIAAQCSEFTGYYSTNTGADAVISDDMKSFLTLPEGFNTEMEMIQLISPEAEDAHGKAWTAFKSAS